MSSPDARPNTFTLTLTLSGYDVECLKDALQQAVDDSDVIWGGDDNHECYHDCVRRLLLAVEKFEQTVVTPH